LGSRSSSLTPEGSTPSAADPRRSWRPSPDDEEESQDADPLDEFRNPPDAPTRTRGIALKRETTVRQPPALNEFVGQKQLHGPLRKLIHGAQSLGEPVPHLLLVGEAGLGKSRLVQAVAREAANDGGPAPPSNLRRLIAGRDVSVALLVGALQKLNACDFLFVDEAHALRGEVQEVLFLALDEQRTYELVDGTAVDRNNLVSVAPFSLIAATNRPGGVLPALRSRLHVMHFARYEVEELRMICDRVATTHGLEFSAQAARLIAGLSQGTPRRVVKAVNLLRMVRPQTQRFDLPTVRAALREIGTDELGLDCLQRRTLALVEANPQRKLSHEVLATMLGLDSPYVRTEVEPFLVSKGLLSIDTRHRRVLTEAGAAALIRVDAVEASPLANDPPEAASSARASVSSGCT
jgi:Holliday junction DNA helicase RuvB